MANTGGLRPKERCVMKWFCRHWYDFGVIPFLIALAVMIINWNDLEVIERLLMMSFIAILVHQFEEYRFPGGEPAIMNIVLQNSDLPDRYPLNQFSAMLTNVLITYTVYLIPIFLPHVIWLGLMPMLFGILQFLVHGIATNIKMRSLYNPGLAAVVFLHFPIGFYYIWYVSSQGMIRGLDWVIAVVYMVLVAGLVVNGLTYRLLPDRNTKWVFDEVEMRRFHVQERMARLKQ